MIISRDFPVERLVSRALPLILPLELATVMLRPGNGVRKGTLATLSGSERGGPRYWANAERSSPGRATGGAKGLTVHDYRHEHGIFHRHPLSISDPDHIKVRFDL